MSEDHSAQPRKLHFEHAEPILRVEDMARALDFYVGKLGFANAEWGGDDFTLIERGGAAIYLCRGDQGRGGAWAWVGISDVTAFHAECVAAGVPVRMPPTSYPGHWRCSWKTRTGTFCALAPSRFPGKELRPPSRFISYAPAWRERTENRIAPLAE